MQLGHYFFTKKACKTLITPRVLCGFKPYFQNVSMHLQQGFVDLNILPSFCFEKVFLTRTSKNTPKATSRLHWEKFLFALSPRIFFRFQFGSLHPGVRKISYNMQGTLRYTFSKLKALEFIFDLMINHNETLASRTILDLSPRIRYQTQILLHIQNRRDVLYHLQHCLWCKIWKMKRQEFKNASNLNTRAVDGDP